ncbi:hypothetical protein EYF80_034007 [Liparis tanakae]|uniref:Uncharacterized protein n=1 Tax=Liparis tanakae TaxID=230148 RepID=A0A4Z2GQV2_9TELE|nr:hypothetical protein EYF80_034007 [Liparis tanakae]
MEGGSGCAYLLLTASNAEGRSRCVGRLREEDLRVVDRSPHTDWQAMKGWSNNKRDILCLLSDGGRDAAARDEATRNEKKRNEATRDEATRDEANVRAVAIIAIGKVSVELKRNRKVQELQQKERTGGDQCGAFRAEASGGAYGGDWKASAAARRPVDLWLGVECGCRCDERQGVFIN